MEETLMASTVMAYNNGIVFSFMRQDVGCSSSSESREVSEGAVAGERSEDMGERNSERPAEFSVASYFCTVFFRRGWRWLCVSVRVWISHPPAMLIRAQLHPLTTTHTPTHLMNKE